MRATVTLLTLLACADPPAVPPDGAAAGRFALRRLTRAEYARTAESLLGAPLPLADDLPPDDSSHGLDVVADALVISPLHVELYEQGAVAISSRILQRPLLAPITWRGEGEDPAAVEDGSEWNDPAGDAYFFGSAGSLTWSVDLPAAGRYLATVTARPDQAGPDGVQLAVLVDGEARDSFTFPLDGPSTWQDVAFPLDLPAGVVQLGVAFVNDHYDPDLGEDRNLAVDGLTLAGPDPFFPVPNPAWDRFVPCDPDGPEGRACAREVLAGLLPWAWRRPTTDAELEARLATVDRVLADGGTPREGLLFALREVFLSPHFLLHLEPESAGGRIDAWALANRLSYFVWSAPPDQALRDHAAAGDLHDPAVLAAEVRRLLRDPRADALTEELAAQWLGIRLVETAAPDPWAYPEFNAVLQASMAGELRTFFHTFVGTDRPLRELMTSDWGYVDNGLARYYGVTLPDSPGFRPAGVRAVHRGGWLGTAGIQTALSYPTRTSPVRRGVWVLTQLLCDEPDPPPADVPGFPEPDEAATTIRERLEQHRANPACAVCHDGIDPVGLAFEHFDGIGRWRDEEDGAPIDATGQLPDGRAFDGLQELQALLAEDPRLYACMVDRLFTWGHHRAPTTADAPHLDHVLRAFDAGGYTLDALVEGVVTSPSFTTTEPVGGRTP